MQSQLHSIGVYDQGALTGCGINNILSCHVFNRPSQFKLKIFSSYVSIFHASLVVNPFFITLGSCMASMFPIQLKVGKIGIDPLIAIFVPR